MKINICIRAKEYYMFLALGQKVKNRPTLHRSNDRSIKILGIPSGVNYSTIMFKTRSFLIKRISVKSTYLSHV